MDNEQPAEEHNITTDTDADGNIIGYTYTNRDDEDRVYRYTYYVTPDHADYPEHPYVVGQLEEE